MSTHFSLQRFLIRKVDGREFRVNITNCVWCGEREDAICAVCADKPNRQPHTGARQ